MYTGSEGCKFASDSQTPFWTVTVWPSTATVAALSGAIPAYIAGLTGVSWYRNHATPSAICSGAKQLPNLLTLDGYDSQRQVVPDSPK